jgi:Tol biopolymer transport system component
MRFPRRALLLVAPLALIATLSAQDLAVELQRAIQRETATGDSKAAIAEYQRIADRAGSNKAVGAQALLSLAEAYQRQGDAEARKVYERIVTRFSDQVEIAAIARARLGGEPRRVAGAAAWLRQVWVPGTRAGGIPYLRISPDGQSLVLVANTGRDLVIRDIASGRERTVLHVDAPGYIFGRPAVSPNGKRIAFSYHPGQGGPGIRVIDTSGSAVRTAMPETDGGTADIQGWSPDGSRLLVRRWSRGNFRLFWLNVKDGTQTTLAEGTAPWGVSGFSAVISPDGRLVVFGGVRKRASSTADSGREIRVIGSDGRSERVLSSLDSDLIPVGWTSDGGAALIVSRRSNTMGLWAFPVSNGVSAGEPRLIERDLCSCGEVTDTTLSVSARDIGDGVAVIGMTVRGDLFFQTRTTRSDIYIARLEAVTGKASATAVPVNTSRKGSNVRPIWSPDGKRLLFFWSTPSGRELSMLNVDDGVERRFPRLVLDRFGVCWTGNDAFVYRRASSDTNLPLPGTAAVEFRRYDLVNGRDQLVFQDEAGFFSCSADGTTVAYRSPPRVGVGFLTTRHLVSGTTSKREVPRETNQVTKLSPRGDELAFYAGTDGAPDAPVRLLIAPTESGTPQREIARTRPGEEFQIGAGNEGLAWSADGRFLYYAKQLAPGADFELFRVPAGGGAEERLGLAGVDLRELSVSPDGSRIAFAMGPLNRLEIWAVQNVSAAAK